MRRIVVATCILTLATIVHAGDTERHALAERLLAGMEMQKTIEKSFEMVKQMMSAQMKQMEAPDEASSGKAQEAIHETMSLIMKDLSWDKLKSDYISIYAETFTEEELNGLVQFYESPVGKKFVEKQPELMERSMQISQAQMTTLMPKLKELAEQRIKRHRSDQAGLPPHARTRTSATEPPTGASAEIQFFKDGLPMTNQYSLRSSQEILRSKMVLGRTIESLGLTEKWEIDQASAVERLKKSLVFTKNVSQGTITVALNDLEGDDSVVIINTICEKMPKETKSIYTPNPERKTKSPESNRAPYESPFSETVTTNSIRAVVIREAK